MQSKFSLNLDKMLSPISDENPIGLELSYDEKFEELSAEVKKSQDIFAGDQTDWEFIYDESLSFLVEQTKDLRLVFWLLRSRFMLEESEHVAATSIIFLHDFIAKFTLDVYPTRVRAKQTLLSHFVEFFSVQLEKSIDRLKLECLESIRDNLEKLNTLFDNSFEANPPYFKSISRVKKAIKQRAEHEKEQNKKAENTKKKQANAQEESTKSNSNVISTVKESINNIRDSQKVFYSVLQCQLHNNENCDDTLRMLRICYWSLVKSAPAHNNQITFIEKLSNTITAQYQQCIDNNSCNQTLFLSLENQLMDNIFWFEGQFLAYQMLQSLSLPNSADNILLENQLFISQFPELRELKYKSGELLIPEAIQQWLNINVRSNEVNNTNIDSNNDESDSTDAITKDINLDTNDTRKNHTTNKEIDNCRLYIESVEPIELTPLDACYEVVLNEVKVLFKTQALKECMAYLMTSSQHSSSLRDRFYWDLTKAKFLRYALQPDLAIIILEQLQLQWHSKPQWCEWEPCAYSQLLEMLLCCYQPATKEYQQTFKQLYVLKPSIAF